MLFIFSTLELIRHLWQLKTFNYKTQHTLAHWDQLLHQLINRTAYEESVVDKFKSNLLLMIFWLNIFNYNS
jgi:hypothetical protein